MLKVLKTYTYKGDVHPSSTREASIAHNGEQICILQNSVGHCCGVTFLCALSYRNKFFSDPINVVKFFNWLTQDYDDEDDLEYPNFGFLFRFKKLCFYLSSETEFYDQGLRDNPNVRKIHEFDNQGSIVTLYEVDLQCLTS